MVRTDRNGNVKPVKAEEVEENGEEDVKREWKKVAATIPVSSICC